MNEPEVILDMLGFPASGSEAATRAFPRTLAVVGLSDNPFKASHSVSVYMQQHGYRILPVNPAIASVLGETSYPALRDLPSKPDVVNVFRLPQHLPAIVDQMIELGLKNLWVQLGIRNAEAAARAEQAGIRVVMDRCILIEHQRIAGR
jgi:predicted CoA-binding protein